MNGGGWGGESGGGGWGGMAAAFNAFVVALDVEVVVEAVGELG